MAAIALSDSSVETSPRSSTPSRSCSARRAGTASSRKSQAGRIASGAPAKAVTSCPWSIMRNTRGTSRAAILAGIDSKLKIAERSRAANSGSRASSRSIIAVRVADGAALRTSPMRATGSSAKAEAGVAEDWRPSARPMRATAAGPIPSVRAKAAAMSSARASSRAARTSPARAGGSFDRITAQTSSVSPSIRAVMAGVSSRPISVHGPGPVAGAVSGRRAISSSTTSCDNCPSSAASRAAGSRGKCNPIESSSAANSETVAASVARSMKRRSDISATISRCWSSGRARSPGSAPPAISSRTITAAFWRCVRTPLRTGGPNGAMRDWGASIAV